jgi:uncharacterized protein (TIGR02466 family)
MQQIEFVNTSHLFSCPIVKFTVCNHKQLNKLIASEARSWRKDAHGVNVSNKGDSWHSPDGLMSRPEPGFSSISKMFPIAASTYAQKIGAEIDISNYEFEANAWVNINKKGGFNSIHTHGRFHLSGVYYVKQPAVRSGQSGMIEFVNSRFDHHIFQELNANAFAPKVSMRPKAGEMIVFPSTLLHSVYPNDTEEERITIAWNLIFRKKSQPIVPSTNVPKFTKRKNATLKI